MRGLLLIFAFLLTIPLYAQQEPQFTMYQNNLSVFNPAHTGLAYNHFASVNGRIRVFDGLANPTSISAVYDKKFSKLKSGIGLNYYRSELGLETRNKVTFNYAFHLPVANGHKLSAGIGASWFNHQLESSWKPFDPFFEDPSIPIEPQTSNFLEFNAGLFYSSEKLNLGISSTQLRETESDYYSNVRHYFFVASYDLKVTDAFVVRPGMFYKTDAISGALDLNVRTIIAQRYWASLTYRTSDAVAIMAGIDLAKKYRIGYSLDYETSVLSAVNRYAHEVVLAYMLK